MARSPPLPLARFLAYLLLIFAGRAERPPTHLQRAILGQEEEEEQQRRQQQQQPQKKIVGRCTGAGEEKEKEGYRRRGRKGEGGQFVWTDGQCTGKDVRGGGGGGCSPLTRRKKKQK